MRIQLRLLAVKGRIRLLRSFDQISHQYQGYTLVLADAEDAQQTFRVALGPRLHAKHGGRLLSSRDRGHDDRNSLRSRHLL